MAECMSHAPGSFSWVELATTDQKAGTAFYRALFGWDVNEQPIGPDETYSIFQIRGLDVAAGYSMRADEREAGFPPHWNLYVSVTSADEAAAKAEGLGARVLVPPFDVMDVGRMAVLQDPTGAVFQVWQAKRHTGTRILNEPGTLCWSELTTRDTRAARSFYSALFGWTAKDSSSDGGGFEYTEFSNRGEIGVGMMAMPEGMPAHIPSYWMPYFLVADCDASTARASGLGAGVLKSPDAIPKVGRFSVLKDPQGAVFALFTFA